MWSLLIAPKVFPCLRPIPLYKNPVLLHRNSHSDKILIISSASGRTNQPNPSSMAGEKMGVEALVCLAALVAGATLFLSQGATAQSSSSCTNTLVSLSPCLDYITGNSTTPTRSCCTQLGNVAGSQPECLCQVIGGGGGGNSLGININQTQALALPAACKVQTPPASSCNNGLGRRPERRIRRRGHAEEGRGRHRRHRMGTLQR
ncbi:unnamed protein product [Linum tenue]|uniref:Bifunctional inhibitor/plant lipid transfer protein/seed storage helical domain-containing protein n=1 Tax=Linum tenue TaxID=586396 RepID=A0AAV0GPN1_9ROSI|nr:unnamed protein product [Linum tenue]